MDNTYIRIQFVFFYGFYILYCSCFQMDNQIKSIWVTICSSFKILIFLLICVNDISESIIWTPRYKYEISERNRSHIWKCQTRAQMGYCSRKHSIIWYMVCPDDICIFHTIQFDVYVQCTLYTVLYSTSTSKFF